MSGEEVNSTNSFVDIIANTTGMIIKLTLLAMLLGHQQSRQVDTQLVRADQARLKAGELRAEQAGLPDRLANAERDLASMRERLDDTTAKAEQADASVAAALAAIEALRAELDQLRTDAGQDAGQLAARRQAAEVELARILAAAEAALRGALETDLAALGTRAATAQQRVAELTRQLADLRARQQATETALAAAETAAAERRRALDAQRAALIHEIDIHRPASQRPYGSTPVLAECYRDAKGLDRIRLLTATNYRREDGAWIPLRDGPEAGAVGQAEEFKPLFGAAADAKRYLYLLVRPEAYAGFRLVRSAAETRGWWVEWDALESGKPLTMGARQSPSGSP